MTDLRPYLRAVAGASKLTMQDRVVLFALAWYANDTGEAWPNSKTLGAACGLHRVNVRQSLGHLVRAGVITAETRTGRSTVYRFPVHPSTTCSPTTTGNGEKPVVDALHPNGGPVADALQGCSENGSNLQSPRYTRTLNLNEEEARATDEPVDNYGDRDVAHRMRAVIEAARDETRAARA